MTGFSTVNPWPDPLARRDGFPGGIGLTIAVLLAVGVTGCQSSSDKSPSKSAPPVVEMTAADYAFVAPDTIPTGWVTFRMANRGEESHHFHLDRLPEGRTFADWREAFKEPADSILQLVAEGKIDQEKVGAAIDRVTPDWAGPDDLGALQTHGGVGLVAPGLTGQTTHHVDPGHYVMICVIRAPNGRPHLSLGMVEGLVAVDSSAEHSPPVPDVMVRGTGREIRMDGALSAGRRTVGFRAEKVPREYQGGTDGYFSVWLARLADTTDTSDVAAWEYTNPAPYESLGGFEYLPPSEAAYVTADLKPGRYAWIWFYEGMDGSGQDEPMVEAFTVE